MIYNPKVICLGEALVDRLGPLGEDPAKSQIDRCENKLGGAPANVACALARLGTPTAFIGRLGHDEFGEAFERLLAKRGVRLEGLQRDEERPTRIVWFGVKTTENASSMDFAMIKVRDSLIRPWIT